MKAVLAFRFLAYLVVVSAMLAAFTLPRDRAEAAPATGRESDAEADENLQELGLSADAITSRIEAVRNDESLSPEARELAVSAYKAALDSVQSAETWEFKVKKYLRLADEASGHLDRIKRAPATDTKAPPPASLSALEIEAAGLLSQIGDLQLELQEVSEEQQRRAVRRVEAPARRSELKRKLTELRASLGAELTIPTSSEPARARAARAIAEEFALAREIAALDAEVASYDARRELLALRRDVASREIASLQDRQKAIQDKIDELRRTEAERAAAEASGTEDAVVHAHPLLREAAARNAALAAARTGPEGLGSKLQRARDFAARITARGEQLAKDFAGVQERAKLVGFTGPVGALLRKQKLSLPDKSFHRKKIRARQDEIGAVQIELLEFEDERAALANPAAVAAAMVASQAPDVEPADASRLVVELQALLETRRGYLDALIEDYDAYFLTLIELDTKERGLLDATSEFADYIDTHVLWIRSTTTLNAKSFASAFTALAWTVRPDNILRFTDEIRALTKRSPLIPIFAVLSIFVFFAVHRRVAGYSRVLDEAGESVLRAQLLPLALAIVSTITSALRWPVVLWVMAWLLDESAGDHARATSGGLASAATALFVFGLARGVCRQGGLGVRHFGWDSEILTSVRRHLTTAMIGVVPATFFIGAMQRQPNDDWKESLGRLAFILAGTCVAVLSYRVLRPSGPIFRHVKIGDDAPAPFLLWTRRLAGPVVITGSAFVVVLAILGYYFAALSLAPHVTSTVRLLFAIVLGRAIALRWIAIARRRHGHGGEDALSDAAEQMQVDVDVATPQDRRLVGNIAAFVLVVGIVLTWNDVLPAFNVLNNVELWRVNASHVYDVSTDAGIETRTGVKEIPITLGSLLQAFFMFFVAMAAARHVPGLLEIGLLRRFRLEPGIVNAITTILGYALVVLGIVVAAARLGLSWSQVQWLAAAVSVGLGFGLQEIFANFVSGIIILFERPIRIGDTVTLGGVTGSVSRINIRATTIVDWDNKELVVPNKEFVTGQLINWTLSNPTLRLIIPVGIAYGSDTKLAEKTLLETAKKNPNVIDDPPPNVVFGGFGDNSLNFELRVFVPHIRYLIQTRHQLHMKIDEAFREAGIEISFPQRDLHLRSVSSPVPVRIES